MRKGRVTVLFYFSTMHKWDLSPKEAIQVQKEWAEKVELSPFEEYPSIIGGADISFEIGGDTIYAGIVTLDFDSLNLRSLSLIKDRMPFPYIPGLLSFREIPSLIKAWQAITEKPKVMVMDGQGIAHTRRFGLASHFGVLTDMPCLGCAKKRFIGTYRMPPEEADSYSKLLDGEDPEQIGWVLRTRKSVKPVFISPGHKLDMDDALRIMRRSVKGYRIPEPTRQAHLAVNAFRRGELDQGTYKWNGDQWEPNP